VKLIALVVEKILCNDGNESCGHLVERDFLNDS
jgi:hypothetical protein